MKRQNRAKGQEGFSMIEVSTAPEDIGGSMTFYRHR